jgi:hypothetical protein
LYKPGEKEADNAENADELGMAPKDWRFWFGIGCDEFNDIIVSPAFDLRYNA